jgi:hypothetical protein
MLSIRPEGATGAEHRPCTRLEALTARIVSPESRFLQET